MILFTSYEGLYSLDETTGDVKKLRGAGCFGLVYYAERKRYYMFMLRYTNSYPGFPVDTGMIVSFSFVDGQLEDFTVEVPSGIQTDTHQIAILDRTLYVQETGIQRIRAFDLDEGNDDHVFVSPEYGVERLSPQVELDVPLSSSLSSNLSVAAAFDVAQANGTFDRNAWIASNVGSPRTIAAGVDEPYACNTRFMRYLNNSNREAIWFDNVSQSNLPGDVSALKPTEMPTGWFSDDRYRHLNAISPSADGSRMFMLSPWIVKTENKNFQTTEHIPGKNFFLHTWSNGVMVDITSKLGSPRAPASIITYTMPGFVKSHEVSTPYNSFCHDLVTDPCNSNVLLMVTSDCEIVRIDTTTGCKVGSNASFSNAGLKWMRGLIYDGDKYIVGCAKTIQVLGSNGDLVAVHNVPAFPCSLAFNKNDL